MIKTDKLVRLYTGLISYNYGAYKFICFFGASYKQAFLLGGMKEQAHKQYGLTKLSHLHQFFDCCKTEAEFVST